MYKRTITLFNRFNNSWYPTIINNVDFNADKAAIIGRYGAQSQDRATLHIRYSKSGDDIEIARKTWLPPKEYRAQESVNDTLTFTDGNENFDFIYVGEWESEEVISDDAYGIDGFYNYMNKHYDGVFSISSVSSPFVLIPHFEIVVR